MDRETQALLLFPLLFCVACAALFIHGLVTGAVWTGEHDRDKWPRDFRAKKSEYQLTYWFWMTAWAFSACFFGLISAALLRS
jgi:hypothetical protein